MIRNPRILVKNIDLEKIHPHFKPDYEKLKSKKTSSIDLNLFQKQKFE